MVSPWRAFISLENGLSLESGLSLEGSLSLENGRSQFGGLSPEGSLSQERGLCDLESSFLLEGGLLEGVPAPLLPLLAFVVFDVGRLDPLVFVNRHDRECLL